MFNHITLQWVQLFRLLFLDTDFVPQTWLFGQLKYSAVFTLLWFLLKFYYFLMCLSWRPLVGMVTHKSGYQLCLCDRCSFIQKVLQDRTLHSQLVKCNWDEFHCWGYLLPFWDCGWLLITYICGKWLKFFVTTLGFALTLSNDEGAWVVVVLFTFLFLYRALLLFRSLTVLNSSL